MHHKRDFRNERVRAAFTSIQTTRRLAREASRIKPEDIAKTRFLYGVGTAILTFFKKLLGFFRRRGRNYHPIRHTFGLFGRSDLRTGAPKWFRSLQKRHLGELPISSCRQMRKLIAQL
jgi:hypothetical protein